MFEKIKKILKEKKDETIFKKFSEHSMGAVSAVLKLQELVESFCSGKDIKEGIVELKEMELESDEKNLILGKELYKGALLPFTATDWFALAEDIDNLVDSAERVSRLLGLKKIKIPENISKSILALMEETVATVDMFDESINLLRKDLDKAREKAAEIRKIREKVREIEYSTFSLIFNTVISSVNTYILKDIIYNISQISNIAVDGGNKITMMAIKYSF